MGGIGVTPPTTAHTAGKRRCLPQGGVGTGKRTRDRRAIAAGCPGPQDDKCQEQIRRCHHRQSALKIDDLLTAFAAGNYSVRAIQRARVGAVYLA